MSRLKRLSALLFLIPGVVSGHAGETHSITPAPGITGLTVDAGLSATYRSGTAVPQDGVWQIPGIQMGGDAFGNDDSFNLDSANVHLTWNDGGRTHVALDLGSHHGGELELEEALVGYRMSDLWQATLEAGRMKARFSPDNLSHPYARPFSENNLIYDAFYGGHYMDDGARLRATPWPGLELGLEAWRGDHYPATAGEGGTAQDAYFYWRGRAGAWHFGLGGWLMMADAFARKDDRLNSGHSHGSAITQTSDLMYSGDQDSAGTRFSLGWQGEGDWRFDVTGEVVQTKADGQLQDSVRQAALEGNYLGWWLQPELRWQRHALAVRYAQLVLDNHLIGAGGEALAEEGGLMPVGNDPDWLGASYRYQLEGGVGLRLEWTRNRSTGVTDDYVGLGVYWAQRLWSSANR